MSPRGWLILGNRLIGVWGIRDAVGSLSSFVNLRLKLFGSRSQIDPNSYLVKAAFDLALAAFLLFGAPSLARWSDEGKDPGTKPRPLPEIT